MARSSLLIGEFKYTGSEDVFSRGLRELLEYIHLAREDDTYLFDDQLETGSVYGLLCTDSVGTETDHIETIRHWDAGFLRDLFT